MRAWAVTMVVVTALIAVCACLDSQLVRCGDRLCPVGAFCTAQGCVLQDQINVCTGLPDGSPCRVLDLPDGVCVEGTCQVGECGNGLVESPAEQCDDGNEVSGDGCSSDCRSTEVCGNGYVDAVKMEQCDDAVAGLSGDGCSSRCNGEIAIWLDATPRTLGAIGRAPLVYDAARDEYVLFGGLRINNVVSDETWVFKNGLWRQRFPPVSPQARHSHSMAYYPELGKVVLFGGSNGPSHFGDMWLWDGSTWTQQAITGGPAARYEAAMAYVDGPGVGDEVLRLYGGTQGGAYMTDTWELAGTQWSQLAGAAPPSGSYQMFVDTATRTSWLIGGSGSMYRWAGGWTTVPLVASDGQPVAHLEPALGQADGSVILFGGRLGNGTLGTKTYRWRSQDETWQLITSMSVPAPRFAAAAAGDGSDLVMFGGFNNTASPPTQTMRMRAGEWSALATTPQPPSRAGAMSAYNGRRGEVLMFGGADSQANRDTWWLSTQNWLPVAPANSPPTTIRAATAFDEEREEVVVFGGTGCGSGANDPLRCDQLDEGGSGSGSSSNGQRDTTYTLREDAWTLRSPAVRPSARVGATMAYVPALGTVLFGGTAGAVRQNDTWLWDGQQWSQLTTSGSPPPMTDARLVYDRAHGVAVLYGGRGALGSVWELAPSTLTWTEITPAQGPEPREHAVFVYHPRRRRTLLFGGRSAAGQPLSDTWELDVRTRTWERRYTLQTPSARYDSTAAYDAVNAQLLVYAGLSSPSTHLKDVWAYSLISNEPSRERCDSDDADGDGLVGCDDPDCYPRCDPYCPPATSCATDRPRCGDGTCAPLESAVCVEQGQRCP